MIIKLEEDWDLALEKGVDILKKGGVIAYPTDTVYGIGGDATNIEVVKRVYKLKKRDFNKPLLVLVSGLKMLLEYFEPNVEELTEIQKYLPGPYAFILKTRKKMLFGEEEIGVRVPNHFFCRKLSEELGKPIITTSANISGSNPAISVDSLEDEIKRGVDLVIDGGVSKYKFSSTVVNIREKRIIRKGYGEYSFEK